MHRRQNYKQEMSEIVKLRKEGYTSGEISKLTGIPRGTITARLSHELQHALRICGITKEIQI